VKKSGAWYTYEGEQLGQGRENAKQFLLDNPEVMVAINDRVRQQLGLDGVTDEVPLGQGPGDDEPISLRPAGADGPTNGTGGSRNAR
ncbi:MAG: DNA recombination/repair protein RecA, partial [Actinomycetota bacterium]|nr:DNA recombination/repair protein RecA [Actinomycetota bacterium]